MLWSLGRRPVSSSDGGTDNQGAMISPNRISEARSMGSSIVFFASTRCSGIGNGFREVDTGRALTGRAGIFNGAQPLDMEPSKRRASWKAR
jgi:hypothetical protein